MRDSFQDDRRLLAADAIVNLLLGALLIIAPESTFQALNLPVDDGGLYRYVMGGVLLGIGLALLLPLKGYPGLTLTGAILINICGAGTLGAWLLLSSNRPDGVGSLILWALTVIILGLALLEMLSRPWASGR
jgi:hypothetical protein